MMSDEYRFRHVEGFTGDRFKDSIECPMCRARMEPLYLWRGMAKIALDGWQCTDCGHLMWNKA